MRLTHRQSGFTLIESLVAITILVVAIAAPMSLASQSLSSAYYARDQITAFHLAQEAIETIRSSRDGNILENLQSGTAEDLLSGIPSTTGQPFTVDTRSNTMQLCGATCPPLSSNGEFYAYGSGSPWVPTRFTRTVRVQSLDPAGDEVLVSVEVRWRTGAFQERAFTLSENMYRWAQSEDDE
jgi:prepilin-type N-terminal cleavage/methylation domain-containing protein